MLHFHNNLSAKMAESEVTSETNLGSTLYAKYSSPQVELSVEQDISSPDKSAADSSDCAMNSDTPIYNDELPNNNVSCADPLDCLDQSSDCPASQTVNKISCELESHERITTQYKMDKELVVKLENSDLGSKVSVSLNKLDSCKDASDPKGNETGGDVSNGVVKNKRKSRGTPRQRSGSSRGRASKKKQPAVATYHSQISGDKNTIKIRIKKSHLTGTQVGLLYTCLV